MLPGTALETSIYFQTRSAPPVEVARHVVLYGSLVTHNARGGVMGSSSVVSGESYRSTAPRRNSMFYLISPFKHGVKTQIYGKIHIIVKY